MTNTGIIMPGYFESLKKKLPSKLLVLNCFPLTKSLALAKPKFFNN